MINQNDILTPEALYKMAKEFHEIIGLKMETDDPDAYIMRGNELVALMATTGKMLADAKYWKDQAIKNSVLNALKDELGLKLPASTLNELIKAESKELNYLVNWITQLDKECKYQIDLLRSLISLRKTEMSNQFINQ